MSKLDNLNRRAESIRHELANRSAAADLATKNLSDILGIEDVTLDVAKLELEKLEKRHAENLLKYEAMILTLEGLQRGASN